MNITMTCIFQTLILATVILLVLSFKSLGQDSLIKKSKYIPSQIDSLLIEEDSAYYYSLLTARYSRFEQLPHFPNPLSSRPALNNRAHSAGITGGYLSLASNYRSFIDTPYAGKNILQHNISGQLYGSVGNIPLQATYLVRRTNSSLFKNIQDVQISLDPLGLRQRLNDKFQEKMQHIASMLEDTLMAKAINLKELNLDLTREWLYSPFQKQRIIEANEILRVPHITYKPQYSPSENKLREDSLRNKAARFLSLYNRVDSIYQYLFGRLDSLKKQYAVSKEKVRKIKSLSQTGLSNYAGYLNWQSELKELDIEEADLPKKYKFLLGIRNLSVGRSPLNYSELTSKNISINGINIEYNSWYYAAFSAGLVDFRFRDFAINAHRQKQYLVMARAGLGNLEKSYFIFSAFNGRKQLFVANPTTAGVSGINIKGYGVEARWRINKNSHLTGEVAESISPDFREPGPLTNTKPVSSDYSNNAFSIKLSSFYPRIGTRVEGLYKYTGSNYQSFSSFQTNATLKTWYAKIDQHVFKRMLKISASLRSNDFSNPYIIQNYKSNTVFKTVGVVFRKRSWPVVSAAYMPMSQYTMLDQQLVENRFQSLNGNVYYTYKVGNTPTASTIMVNKFYNSGSDTGFIYFNASNVYFAQNIFLGNLVASLAVSDTRNNQYQCQVFDESVQVPLGRFSTLTTGVKINNFNRQEVKVGAYMNSSIKVFKTDVLYISFERGFLPGTTKRLIKNDIASIQFIKTFGTGATRSLNNSTL